MSSRPALTSYEPGACTGATQGCTWLLRCRLLDSAGFVSVQYDIKCWKPALSAQMSADASSCVGHAQHHLLLALEAILCTLLRRTVLKLSLSGRDGTSVWQACVLDVCMSSPGCVRHGSECKLPFRITFWQHAILAAEPGACLGIGEALQGQTCVLAELRP